MSPTRMRSATLALLSLLAPGCRSFQDPVYEVGERKILAVPFRNLTQRFGHGYGESPQGKSVVTHFRRWVETETDGALATAVETEKVVRVLREKPKSQLTPKEWKAIATGVDADLVIVGEITKLEQDSRMVNFVRGLLSASYSVIDTATGREVYQREGIDLEFPPARELQKPMDTFESSFADAEKSLLRQLGERIGKDLFGYYKE